MGAAFSRWVVTAALAVSAPAGGADDDWKKLLDKPVSPATVALLVAHAKEEAVLERWADALSDARPEVRAAAARVVNVSAAATLVPHLLAALGEETEPAAALEQIRALAALGTPAVDQVLIEAAKRDLRFVEPVATTLARARGASARRHLGALRELGLDAGGRAAFFERMSEAEPDLLETLGSIAVREAEDGAWEALLRSGREVGRPPGVPLLCASLTSPSARMRAATYWHVLLAFEGRYPGDLEKALESTPEALGEGGDAGSTFAFELLHRRSGRSATHRREWTELLRSPAPLGRLADDITEPHVVRLLDKEERESLSLARTGKPDGLGDPRTRPHPSTVGHTPVKGRLGELEWDSLRMPADYPPGFVSDLVAVAKCRAPSSSFGGGVVRYRRDGRPATVSFFRPESECPDLVRALLMTALSPPRAQPEHTAVLIVPLGREVLACMADTSPHPSAREGAKAPPADPRVGMGIEEPRKTRNVPPAYPSAARRARIEGVVTLGAEISISGCVRKLEVLRSVEGLDIAAFIPVSQWRYTPTLLDGVPVPVIMTVTVNFRLN